MVHANALYPATAVPVTETHSALLVKWLAFVGGIEPTRILNPRSRSEEGGGVGVGGGGAFQSAGGPQVASGCTLPHPARDPPAPRVSRLT